jgi:ABC-type microcin C transport system permease subunit YejB
MHNYVARRFTMIMLAAAVAISASFNIVQFQLSKSIQDNIAELQNENSQLREQLITAESNDNSSSYSAEHNNGIRQAPLSFSDTNNFSLSRSITAVAIKAVATTDGSF